MSKTLYFSKQVMGGGTADALDSLDGNLLVDGDVAYIFYQGQFWLYKLNASAGGSADYPYTVAPIYNAGTKMWIRQAHVLNPYTPDGSSIDGYTLTQGASQDKTSNITGAPNIAEQQICRVDPKEAGTYFVKGMCEATSDSSLVGFRLYIRVGVSTYASASLKAQSEIDCTIANMTIQNHIIWCGSVAAGEYIHLGGSVTCTGGSSSVMAGTITKANCLRFFRVG
jgi:hypothetical protein